MILNAIKNQYGKLSSVVSSKVQDRKNQKELESTKKLIELVESAKSQSEFYEATKAWENYLKVAENAKHLGWNDSIVKQDILERVYDESQKYGPDPKQAVLAFFKSAISGNGKKLQFVKKLGMSEKEVTDYCVLENAIQMRKNLIPTLESAVTALEKVVYSPINHDVKDEESLDLMTTVDSKLKSVLSLNRELSVLAPDQVIDVNTVGKQNHIYFTLGTLATHIVNNISKQDARSIVSEKDVNLFSNLALIAKKYLPLKDSVTDENAKKMMINSSKLFESSIQEYVGKVVGLKKLNISELKKNLDELRKVSYGKDFKRENYFDMQGFVNKIGLHVTNESYFMSKVLPILAKSEFVSRKEFEQDEIFKDLNYKIASYVAANISRYISKENEGCILASDNSIAQYGQMLNVLGSYVGNLPSENFKKYISKQISKTNAVRDAKINIAVPFIEKHQNALVTKAQNVPYETACDENAYNAAVDEFKIFTK
ncbi:MAG: hypothetical protein WC755_04730, partial [Candidatus Woesearchaeota archaeon]